MSFSLFFVVSLHDRPQLKNSFYVDSLVCVYQGGKTFHRIEEDLFEICYMAIELAISTPFQTIFVNSEVVKVNGK